jgi:peptidoglycan/xylan/chitin deacetylase (PgdA/CDA1 family)
MIMCFHNIGKYTYPLPARNDISVHKFKSIIFSFLRKGYKFVTPEEYFSFEKYNNFSQKLLITFDDGYADQYVIIRDFLKHLQIPALVFIATGYLNRKWDSVKGIKIRGLNESEVKDLTDWGYTLGAHGHKHKIFQKLSDWRDDLKKAVDILSNLSREKISYYSFPFGNHSIFDAIFFQKIGFKKAFGLGEKFIFYNKESVIINRVPVSEKDSYFSLQLKRFFYELKK